MNIPIIYTKRFAACLLSCLLLAGTLAAQQRGDHPVVLNFRLGSAQVESTCIDNRLALYRLDSLFADTALVARIDSVNIFSFASPDGQTDRNLTLARQRSASTRAYLLNRYRTLDVRLIHLRPQGEDWQGLRRLIAADDCLPARDEALQIIDQVADNARCKILLKKLDGGRPYRHIAQHILPLLRNASVCIVYLSQPLPRITALQEAGAGLAHVIGAGSQPFAGQADSLQQSGITARKASPGSKQLPGFPPYTHTITLYPAGTPAVAPCHRRPLLALKTNLLFDLAMAPNIEIEVPFGKQGRWSVNAEWTFPWWMFEGDKYCFQVLSGGLEGRYWLGNRNRRRTLTGHFVGFYAGGGKYDLQWDRDGYQGEFYIASGISYGYACPIGRNLSLEFSIGVGLLRTSYEHYHTLDNYQTLLWQNNGRYTWLGPTKAKISFVWLLGRKAKVQQKGGAR